MASWLDTLESSAKSVLSPEKPYDPQGPLNLTRAIEESGYSFRDQQPQVPQRGTDTKWLSDLESTIEKRLVLGFEEEPLWAKAGQAVTSAAHRLGEIGASGLKGAGVAKAAIDRFLIGTDVEGEETAPYAAGKALEGFLNDWLPDNPKLKGSMAWDKIPGAVGSTVGFAAAAPFGAPGMAALGASVESGQLYDEAKAAGASENTAMKAAAWGIPIGASEAFNPAERALKRLDSITGGTFKQTVKRLLTHGVVDSFAEGVQEGVQRLGENEVAKLYEDRDFWDGVKESFQVGGASSAIINAILLPLGLRNRGGRPEPTKQAPDAPAGTEQAPTVDVPPQPQPEVIQTGPNEFKLPGEPKLPEGASLVETPQPVKPVSRETPTVEYLLSDEGRNQFARQNPEGSQKLVEAVRKGSVPRKLWQEVTGIATGSPSAKRIAFARALEGETQNVELQGNIGEAEQTTVTEEVGDQVQSQAVEAQNAPQAEEVLEPGFQDVLAEEEAEQAEARPSTPLGVVAESTRKLFKRSDTIGSPQAEPAKILPENKEAARRIENAFGGVQQPSFTTKAIEGIKSLGRKATRQFEHIPNKPEFATAIESLQAVPQARISAADDAVRSLKAIAEPLGPNQRKLFTYKLALDDAVRGLKEGNPLRFGFTSPEEVESEKARIDGIVGSTPEVKSALERREKIASALTKELFDNDLLPKEAAANTSEYYHRQVLAYAQAQAAIKGSGKITPTDFSFQKGRVEGDTLPEEFDYNLDYVQAEGEWMTHALTALNKKKQFDQLMNRYDRAKEVRAAAKAKNLDSWRTVMPEGHVRWNMRPGHTFYPAVTIPESIANKLIDGTLDEAIIKEEDLRKLIAIGAPKTYVIPKEIAAQLDEMEKFKETGALDKAAVAANNLWKGWTLVGPHKLGGVAYNLRNLTGDIDPIIGGAIPALAEVKDATADLWKYFKNGEINADVRAARDLGVIDSSMTATEIPEFSDLPVFRQMYESKLSLANVPANTAKAYYDFVHKWTKYREAILRFAAFQYYRKALNRGSLAHYGGAKKSMVQALQKDLGNDVAAGYLSRKLLGDYRATSALGNWIATRLIPFWRWTEVNMRRYPRMTINAIDWANTKSAGNKAAMPLYAAMGLSALGALYAAQWAWNNLIFPDEEKKLGSWDRQNPHLILGKLQDDSPLILRNVGAVGDVLEWFGLNTLIGLLPKYQAGTLTGKDLFDEMKKDPLNKLVQGALPLERGALETITGTSHFPDVTEPRKVPRDEAAAGVFGLTDIYKEAKGRILKEGSRARPHFIARTLFGVSDPRTNALSEAHALREKFLESKGKGVEAGSYGQSPTATMRRAVASHDYEAFLEARAAYLEKGFGYDNFKRSIERIDPVENRLSDELEVEFEQKFLTGEDRDKVREARDYAQDLRVQMWNWWKKSANEKDEPAERAELDAAIRKEMYGVFTTMTDSKKPERHKKESNADYLARRQRRSREIEDAGRGIDLYGMTKEEIIKEVRREHRRRGMDVASESFQERLGRLRRALNQKADGKSQ